MPELPTCSEITVSVFSHASTIGGPVVAGPQSEGRPDRVRPVRGSVTDVNPRLGVAVNLGPRRSAGSAGYVIASGTMAVRGVAGTTLEQPVVPRRRTHAKPELTVRGWRRTRDRRTR